MDYQQILAIPFYFNAINSAFMEIQKTSSGVSRKVNQELVPKDIYLYTISTGPKFYVITPDNVDDTIRCISNISAFLTNSRHTYNFECRPFDF